MKEIILKCLETVRVDHICKYLKKNHSNIFDVVVADTVFLKDVSFSERLYCFLKDIKSIQVCYCGKKLLFLGFNKGYGKYCSRICSEKSVERLVKIKQTCLEKYGVSNVFATKTIKKKIKETVLKKYGVKHQMLCNEVKDKHKKTCLEKYGVDNVFKNESIKKKIKVNTLKKLGVEHNSQSNLIKEKKKKTSLKHFGVEHPLKSDLIMKKIKKTCLEKYGVDNVFKNDFFKKKYKKTCLEKYGVEYYVQTDEAKKKRKKTCLEKYGVENYAQTEEAKEKYIERLLAQGELIFPNIGLNEKNILDEQERILGRNIERNYRVGRYFVDGYCKELNIVFEVNEKYHYSMEQIDKDLKRKIAITKKLDCDWMVIKDETH